MPVLKIKDELGNWIAVPVIVGQTAYQAAVEGGYTGTEAEFYDALANSMLIDGSNSSIIRATFDDGSYIERDTDRLTWVFVDTDGTTANIPNELWYGEDKASEAILNGQMGQFAGVQGDHSLSKVAVPSEINANPYLLMGMATKDHANNEWTKLTEFGVVHDVNTNGWVAGTILYFDSVNGGLTNVKPTYPNAQIMVGAVLVASETAGAIVVRRSVMQGANEVDVDESQFTGFLDGSTTTQEALEVLDTHNHDDRYFTETEINTKLGNQTYTEDNYVTDSESLTASVDALDVALKDVSDSNALKAPLASPTFTGTPTLSGVGRIIADSASTGTDIYYIWSGTQAQYDAIGTKDANTLYFIVQVNYETWNNKYNDS